MLGNRRRSHPSLKKRKGRMAEGNLVRGEEGGIVGVDYK